MRYGPFDMPWIKCFSECLLEALFRLISTYYSSHRFCKSTAKIAVRIWSVGPFTLGKRGVQVNSLSCYPFLPRAMDIFLISLLSPYHHLDLTSVMLKGTTTSSSSSTSSQWFWTFIIHVIESCCIEEQMGVRGLLKEEYLGIIMG